MREARGMVCRRGPPAARDRKKLLTKAEDWAREHNSVEIASDALIENQLSQRAHERLGYEVVDRCVQLSEEAVRLIAVRLKSYEPILVAAGGLEPPTYGL